MLGKWRNAFLELPGRLRVDCSDDLRLEAALGCEAEVQRWNDAGLPSSQFALENACVMTHARRWSLLVDPQDQVKELPSLLGQTAPKCSMSSNGVGVNNLYQGNAWVRRMWRSADGSHRVAAQLLVLKGQVQLSPHASPQLPLPHPSSLSPHPSSLSPQEAFRGGNAARNQLALFAAVERGQPVLVEGVQVRLRRDRFYPTGD